MALGGKIVDFVGLHLAYRLHHAEGVTQVAIVEMEAGMSLQMGYAFAKVYRRPSDNPMYLVTLFQQELGQIASVLSCDACNQCSFHRTQYINIEDSLTLANVRQCP